MAPGYTWNQASMSSMCVVTSTCAAVLEFCGPPSSVVTTEQAVSVQPQALHAHMLLLLRRCCYSVLLVFRLCTA